MNAFRTEESRDPRGPSAFAPPIIILPNLAIFDFQHGASPAVGAERLVQAPQDETDSIEHEHGRNGGEDGDDDAEQRRSTAAAAQSFRAELKALVAQRAGVCFRDGLQEGRNGNACRAVRAPAAAVLAVETAGALLMSPARCKTAFVRCRH